MYALLSFSPTKCVDKYNVKCNHAFEIYAFFRERRRGRGGGGVATHVSTCNLRNNLVQPKQMQVSPNYENNISITQ